MNPDFSPLRQALKECRRQNVPVKIWWRDDDAIEPTKPLDQLFVLAEKLECPVHLAIIPKHAKATLPDAMDPKWTRALVHGWAHENHEDAQSKKSELGNGNSHVKEELQCGLAKLQSLFGDRSRKVLVPPWNRISDDAIGLAKQEGYKFLSRFGPARQDQLKEINTHIDPIFWKGDRDLVEPDRLVAETVKVLNAHCTGETLGPTPMGFLTHHLIHTPRLWEFTERWINEMKTGGAEAVGDVTELGHE